MEKKSGIPALPTPPSVAAAVNSNTALARSVSDKNEVEIEKDDLVLQDTFAQETAVMVEDPNMLRYVEQELAKKRSKNTDAENRVENDVKRAEDELYKIPEHLKLKVKKRNSEEQSTQWTTGIAEVQLPIEFKLRNIEETEAAKKLLQEKRLVGRTKADSSIPASFSADFFQRGKDYAENLRKDHPELSKDKKGANETGVEAKNQDPVAEGAGRRQAATDEFIMGELMVEKHVKYILTIEKRNDDFASMVMEHLRLNGAYWGLTTLDILGKLDAVDQDEVISWVMQCQHESGGFGGNIGHDPHLLYTLSAIQVLALFDKIDVLDIEKVANYIASLQNEDGSFSGDIWGEIDSRFSYVAICCLALLQSLDKINVERAVEYIVSCKNLDGGFGCTPGAESHAGQIFCCVGALAITSSLHHVDIDLLGWWLCERQVKSGGLNGRPEKLPDVCYSWWVLSSLIMIDRVHWIDKEKLAGFILDCQDKENGGISDRPDDAVDIFHTYFGVAGLSLLEYPQLKAIDPAYALPVDVVNRIFLSK